MAILSKKLNNIGVQYGLSILAVAIIAITSFFLSSFINYQIVALLLLVIVSLTTTVFHIKPVLLAAVLSTLVLNYFFIPPVFTFHIATSEDVLLFAIYFIVALVSAVLSYKIRQTEKNARDKEEKENTIKLYNTLLNSLSHELRTPIATIVGSVDTLKENNQNVSPENQQILLNEIDKASIRLNAQVENLLNMSRLESGILKLNLDWCDMNELIHSIIQKFRTTNYNHQLVFEDNITLPLFKIDAGLIEQVLHNIIHNAILYTPLHSTITIQALFVNEKCTLIISDNGNGFAENEIQFVFDKFYRLPHTQAGGTGLGLSIAKGFVEAHNGTIVLKNNKGAQFTISIPAEVSFINKIKHE